MARPRVAAAALNNAEWCDAVCRAHGWAGEFGPSAWISPRRAPPFYPDVVTLDDVVERDVLQAVDLSPGCAVKDSFARWDLTSEGFEVLFEARWIFRDARPCDVSGWEPLADMAAFGLPEALLGNESVLALGGEVGRVIASRSETVVGLSNLTTTGDPDEAWASAVTAVTAAFPGLPMVGYERGDGLEAALRQGFEPIGSLRVWLLR